MFEFLITLFLCKDETRQQCVPVGQRYAVYQDMEACGRGEGEVIRKAMEAAVREEKITEDEMLDLRSRSAWKCSAVRRVPTV